MTENELKNTKTLVKLVLEQDSKARNSDSFLYCKVLDILGVVKEIDLSTIPVTIFLQNMKSWGFPAFETVRRTRQKIQAENPHLAAERKVKKARTENEKVFREFARGEM